MNRYLVIDLEMSGMDADWHDIIQIGAVLYDENWIEKGQFLDNVYPQGYNNFNAGAEKVHGISKYDLEDAPMLSELLPELEDWIMEKLGYTNYTSAQKEGVIRNVVLCGQSVINDIHFLKVAYKNEKMKFPFSFTLIDLHTLSHFVFRVLHKLGKPTPKGRSLGVVASFFGFERENDTHNALEDAILTGKCLKKMWEIADSAEISVGEGTKAE